MFLPSPFSVFQKRVKISIRGRFERGDWLIHSVLPQLEGVYLQIHLVNDYKLSTP